MLVESMAAVAGLLGAERLAHHAILRGLRAPRVPHALQPPDLAVAPDCVRALRLPGPGGRTLFAWLVVPAGAQRPVPAVLVIHGWGANAAMMCPVVPPLHATGHAVLLVDARCHGLSDGEAFTSLPRFAEDIAAAREWLRGQPEIAAGHVAVLGHSVGAAAALLYASRRTDVRAVVSLSSFAHPWEVMRRFMAANRVPYPVVGWYVLRHVQRVIGASFDSIAPVRTISAVRCPVLLVHGRQDSTVPFDDAVRLRAAAANARLLLVDGDHDLRLARGVGADALVAFLRDAFAGSADATGMLPSA